LGPVAPDRSSNPENIVLLILPARCRRGRGHTARPRTAPCRRTARSRSRARKCRFAPRGTTRLRSARSPQEVALPPQGGRLSATMRLPVKTARCRRRRGHEARPRTAPCRWEVGSQAPAQCPAPSFCSQGRLHLIVHLLMRGRSAPTGLPRPLPACQRQAVQRRIYFFLFSGIMATGGKEFKRGHLGLLKTRPGSLRSPWRAFLLMVMSSPAEGGKPQRKHGEARASRGLPRDGRRPWPWPAL